MCNTKSCSELTSSESEIPLYKCKYGKLLESKGIHRKLETVVVNNDPELPVHFTSDCHCVSLRFEDELPPVELFVKRVKGNAEIKEESESSLYEREANVYKNVFPYLKQICENHCRNPDFFNVFPNAFHIGEGELILENLITHEIIDRNIGHGFAEACAVLKSLAGFHSASYVPLRQLGVENFQAKFPHTRERMMNREGVGASINTEMMGSTYSKVMKLLETSDLEGASETHASMKRFEGKVFSTMCDVVEKESEFNVLNHGDCWSNNILLRKDENGNFSDAKFVDFQMVRVGSPNLDISFYLYNSVQQDVREKEWRTLLKVYYDELCRCIRLMGGELHLTFDKFLNDHGIFGQLGYLYGIFVAAASPVMGKVNFDNSENWIQDFVNAICEYLDRHPEDKTAVLNNVISMTKTYEITEML